MPQHNPTISPANNRFDANQGCGYDAAGNLTGDPQQEVFTSVSFVNPRWKV